MKLPALELSLQFESGLARQLGAIGQSDAAALSIKESLVALKQNRAALEQHRAALGRSAVARWIRHALEHPAQIAVRIVGFAQGQTLNNDYRQKNYATNVLTFEYAKAPIVMADVVLCAPVVEREALQLGKSLRSHYAHLLVHATLHAQGWDHEKNAAQARAMESRESQILTALGFENPYHNS